MDDIIINYLNYLDHQRFDGLIHLAIYFFSNFVPYQYFLILLLIDYGNWDI